MSVENRKAMYDKLVKEDRLSQDDGSLVQEFGEPQVSKAGTSPSPSVPEDAKPKEETKKKKGK